MEAAQCSPSRRDALRASECGSVEITAHGLSEVFLNHLKLNDALLVGASCVGRGHLGDERTQWWYLPPGHLDRWCCNQHGTLHGGLSLALLCALSKAHVAMYRSGGGGEVGNALSVGGVHMQYMMPVILSSALTVRTVIDTDSSGIVRVSAKLYKAQESHEAGGKQQQPSGLRAVGPPLCKATIVIKRRMRSLSSL